MRQSPLPGELWQMMLAAVEVPCAFGLSHLKPALVECRSRICLSKHSQTLCFDSADQARERTGKALTEVECKYVPSMLIRAKNYLNASSRLLVPIHSVAGNYASVQENQKADDAKSDQEPCWSVPGRICAAGVVGRGCHGICGN